ncbi:MAG: hypothetical protein EZS28_018265 [Streblomastix strix]|uniref:Nucleolar protein 58/56 N-terminal domain-containing protein n=1 Tax=Streblomastix strix TaxID=222440 RepID=A0A5J4VUD0_9EUKA|nr:MAG: hypothetical protein EZS28_018265 [Streblomastix strix]
MTQKLYILYESAPGYALFDCAEPGETVSDPKNSTDMARFSQNVKLTAFAPFTHPEHALSAIQNVSTGVLGKDLQELLLTHLPPVKKDKTSNYQLGVTEPRIAAAIQNEFKISCFFRYLNCKQKVNENIEFRLKKFYNRWREKEKLF